MKIVFMGTPGFAVPGLAALLDAGFEVVAVVTAPDRRAGRGQQLNESDVKKFAVSRNIPVLQPEKLKDPAFLDQLSAFNADLQVVVAFRMLPEVVWNMPGKGTINLHASLLPKYRGAAPINHAIINGETETGVTTFFLQHEIDTGNVIESAKVEITPNETAGTLHDKLMNVGSSLLVKTVQSIQDNTFTTSPQPDTAPIHAPKLTKEFGRINWNRDSKTIMDHIRGLSPYPAAFTTLNGKNFKIFATKKGEPLGDEKPGDHNTDGKSFLKFAATDNWIYVTDIQLEGKKRMPIEDLLRGVKMQDYEG